MNVDSYLVICSASPHACLVGISNFISKLSSLTLPYSPHPPTHTPQTCPFQALATRSEPRGGGCEDVVSRAVGLESWSDSAAWRLWAVQERSWWHGRGQKTWESSGSSFGLAPHVQPGSKSCRLYPQTVSESDHFSPPLLLPHWFKPPPSLRWLLQ